MTNPPRSVTTKLRPPRLGPEAVERASLLRRLDTALENPLTVVTAPAGFGKTWLVADWLASHPDVAQGWVTVDRFDNDPARFWLHTVSAVCESACPNAGADASALMDSPGTSLAAVVDALAAGLAEEEFVLVLDDIHLLDSAETLRLLRQFLDMIGPTLHVVLVGRHDPGVPLARRRMAGQVVEIRTVDLRCSFEEAAEVVSSSMGLDIADQVVAVIHQKAMGWLAGIRLAAQTVAASPDTTRSVAQLPAVSAIDGAYDAIGDYLVEEALDDLSGDDRQFLLDTSILSTLSGPLCDTVTGRTDSHVVLERFTRSGLFTSRLDTSGGDWYRYHDLLRTALVTLLHRTTPDREQHLHHRAAVWHHDAGDTISAIDHALAGNDPALAAEWLIDTTGPMLMGGEAATLCTLYRRVDAESDEHDPIFLASWCFPVLYCEQGIPDIDPVLSATVNRIRAMSAEEHDRLRDRWLRLPAPYGSPDELVRGIGATLAHRRGDVALASNGLAEQGEVPSASGFVEAVAGEMLIYTGRYVEGLRLLEAWKEFSFSAAAPDVGNHAIILSCFAWARIGQGDLAGAEAMADRAIETMRASRADDRPFAAVPVVPLAWVAWEQGDLDAAEALVTSVLDRIDHFGEIPAFVYAHTLLARIHHSCGNYEDAGEALDAAIVAPDGPPLGDHWATLIALERTRFALLNQDLPTAERALPDWRTRRGRGAATMFENHLLTRLTIATGGDSTPLLDQTPAGLDVTPADHIEQQKLRALQSLHDGNETQALEHLTEAMEIAAQTGHRQTFLDEVGTFGALLDNAAARAGHHLRTHRQPLPTPPSTVSTPALVDPLTQRELEILHLLPTHLTYQQIADELYVSPNTIKSYIKSIYRKLEADKRSDAVSTANSLGLI